MDIDGKDLGDAALQEMRKLSPTTAPQPMTDAVQNSLASIVPDLATGWSWNEDGTELTLPLHQGVAWHDGKPFTAKYVQCTWDMLTGKR